MNGDAVVEVHRVHHPAQRACALALVTTGEPEHAARRLGVAHSCLVTGSVSGSPLGPVSYVSVSHHFLAFRQVLLARRCAIICGASSLNTINTSGVDLDMRGTGPSGGAEW
jgi:hypothetical protein